MSSKRMLSILLVLAMLVSLVPGTFGLGTLVAATTGHPDTFTFTVSDEDGAVGGASISYNIKAGDETLASGSATTDENGEAEVLEMAEYADRIADEEDEVSINYIVSADDHEEVSGFSVVENAAGNVDVVLEKVVPPAIMYEVKVTKIGDGTVLLDGAEVESVELEENSETDLKVTPAAGYEIQSVAINKEEQTIADGGSFETKLTVTGDVEIEVVFKKIVYQITVNDPEHGTASISATEVEWGEGFELTVEPEDGYSLEDIKANGSRISTGSDIYKYASEDTESGGYKVTFSEVKEALRIDVSFVETVPISFSKDNLKFNSQDIARYEGETLYIFKKDTTVKFQPLDDYTWISINEENKIRNVFYNSYVQQKNITENKVINSIEYGYWDLFTKWKPVSIPKSGLTIIIDNQAPDGTTAVSPAANEYGYHNSNVKVSITATDQNASITTVDDRGKKKETTVSNSYSGIATITYRIKCDGKVTKDDELLYQYKEGDDSDSSIWGAEQSVTQTVDVDATANNSNDVVVEFTITDLAGNSKTVTQELKINSTPPTIESVTIDGELHEEADAGFYNTTRTATIRIIDRSDCFEPKNIVWDYKENGVSFAPVVKWTADKDNKDLHIGTIEFKNNGRYEWDILSYTSKSGLSVTNNKAQSGDTNHEFTIDTNSPEECEITVGNQSNWESIKDALTFGLFTNQATSVSITASDNGSAVKSIMYYKDSKKSRGKGLNADDLEKSYKQGDFAAYTDSFDIASDDEFVIYARITDRAGNTKYINTEGVIVDLADSDVKFTFDAPHYTAYNGESYYNADFNVQIDIDDTTSDGHYSGIKTVEYWVMANIDSTEEVWYHDEKPLYNSDITAAKHPKIDDLQATVSETINIDTDNLNSNKVWIRVQVTDHAGNIQTYDSNDVKVSVDEPEITIEYLQNEPINVSDDKAYFDKERIAEITFQDNDIVFDQKLAEEAIQIAGYNLAGDCLTEGSEEEPSELDTSKMIQWSQNEENPNLHIATITFSDSANYTLDEEALKGYTNLAGNQVEKVDTAKGTKYPYAFTVDRDAPSGTVEAEGFNIWSDLIEKLTFGIFTNKTVKITATAEDKTSPVEIYYYKTSDPILKSDKELDKLGQGEDGFAKFADFTIEQDEQFVVYIKIVDSALNRTYISTNGFIRDTKKPSIDLKYDAPNENGIYNDSIDVVINAKDDAPSSDIKRIQYTVTADGHVTQTEEFTYAFDLETPHDPEKANEQTKKLTIDKKLNNSCNVELTVEVEDNAGNIRKTSETFDIDITAPTIKVTYDNNKDNGGNGYFDATRTATVVITERSHHFDADAATKGITITAVDVAGKEVANAYTISGWTTKEGATPDAATHTATIRYTKDANYTFAITYTDKADNKAAAVDVSGQTAPYKFTVDTTAPEGTITAKSAEGREDTRSALVDNLTFGFWSNQQITLSGTSKDATSPIASVQYYMPTATRATDGTTALTKADLDKVTSWQPFNTFSVKANNQFTVYLKITDNAGNYTYISTNGLIVDDQHPIEETVAPEITVTPQQPVNGIYNGNVVVDIAVEEPLVGGTYSGLREITYKVFDRTSSTPNAATQEGTLYTFDQNNPRQLDLKKSWNGSITVNSAVNNSNDIQIVVYAWDNAGNYVDNEDQTSSAYCSVKIDTTAPTIDISYDNNSADNGTYFKNDRTATIVITERNFDPADVRVTITNSDGTIPATVGWSTSAGSLNQDNTTHTGTITYSADGDYTFAIAFTDQAGNTATSINYAAGTVAGTEFTIDKTLPVITVSYDNEDAQNGSYYKEDRTATITINEHNFSADRVTITMTATDDGETTTIPSVSGWSSSGNNHTATITYPGDALYTFDIAYTDMAGNDAADYAGDTFYVDTTAPELSITGVKDKSANKGSVIPVVTYSDTNLDDTRITITLTGANRGSITVEGTYEEIHNGQIFTFKEFEELKEVDDIYTLTVTLTDKAGNTSTETIRFSVNRFGSTYILSDSTEKLIGTYRKAPQDVVITEINADELHNFKVTLFKNNETIVLEEGKDYKVEVVGGNGEWYEYVYTIFAGNFEDDGVYRITLHSEDAAGNVAENTLDTKEANIGFGIDKTLPTINVKNLKSGETYPLENMTVELTADDNLQLVKVTVVLDGKVIQTWEGEELEKLIAAGGEFTFDVPGDSTSAHTVSITAVDAAGNEYTEDINNFYVTTNLAVRYYNNKPLFYGSIGGAAALAALIIFLIAKRKKKDEDEEQKAA